MMLRMLLVSLGTGMLAIAADRPPQAPFSWNPNSSRELLDKATQDALQHVLRQPEGTPLQLPANTLPPLVRMTEPLSNCAEPLLLAHMPMNMDPGMPRDFGKARMDSMGKQAMPVCPIH